MSTNSGVPDGAVPAPARRFTAPGWRDPRLWIGMAIVAVSVVAGARLFASADDTVAMWTLTDDAGVGAEIGAADVEVRRVRFSDSADEDRYLSAVEPLPADAALVRGVGAGELLPKGALGSSQSAGTVEVPVAVADEQVPGSVAPGSVVSVYLVARNPGGGRGGSEDNGASRSSEGGPVLSEVTVVDAPAIEESFGTSGKRQVLLAVTREQVDAFFTALAGSQDPTITVVRVG